MKGYQLTGKHIAAYGQHLRNEERSPGTIAKYLRDIGSFMYWADGKTVTKELVACWKEQLLARKYAPVTINSMLAALNGVFHFLGWDECRIRFLRVQRQIFRDSGRELRRAEYERLLGVAQKQGKVRLALLMETICATGIRVSEVRYITVESARQGRTDVSLKGKIRTILIPDKLCRKLLKYAQAQKTVSGEIFLTGNGKSLTRRQIWAEMKGLCKLAGVEPTKVFPHNLRHLFAETFYNACKDVVRLADVLGHSSIDTTRIYLVTSGKEHARQMARLGLIS